VPPYLTRRTWMAWIGQLEDLGDDVLETCRYTGVGDEFDWDSVVKQLEVVRRIARELDARPAQVINDGIRAQAVQAFEQLVGTVRPLAVSTTPRTRTRTAHRCQRRPRPVRTP